MPRSVELSLSLLESREVPAAGLFADIRPGVWGANPDIRGQSGSQLYFTANSIDHGTELWATDGTRGGTRLVKDINPGKGSSYVTWATPAGDGVMYFSRADRGSAPYQDYRTDGTAAGTVPTAVGPTSIGKAGGWVLTGWKGELFYMAKTDAAGGWALMTTDGTTATELTRFDGQKLDTSFRQGQWPAWPNFYDLVLRTTDTKIELTVRNQAGVLSVWETDGTPGGTRVQQSNLTAPNGQALLPGVEIAPGRFVFRSVPQTFPRGSTLWVGGGTSADRQLLRSFDAPAFNPEVSGVGGTMERVGERVVFSVGAHWYSGFNLADVGMWTTDGTPEGTRKLDIPLNTFRAAPQLRGVFDGRVVARVPTDDPERSAFYLTDGTAAGTTRLPTPAGLQDSGWILNGIVPPDAANPKGYLLFQERANGSVYRTDGTPAGTALVDVAGMPFTPELPFLWWQDGGRYVTIPGGQNARGAYINGAVFFPHTTGDPRLGTELWKWDVTPTAPLNVPAPTVTSTQVNDGSAQRSMVKTLTVTFSTAVTVAPVGVTLTDAGGRVVAFTQQTATANGVTTLTVTFPNQVGGSIADGRYSLRVRADAVRTVAGGRVLDADHTFGFTRLYGDTSGDGVYDRDTRTLVKQLLGQSVGSPGYRWDLDVNSDGKIDAADELAAVRNWGKAV